MQQALIAFMIFMAVMFAAHVWATSPTVEYCDPDMCAASRAEIQHYHDQSPWTSYDATKVTVVVNR